MLIMPPLLFYMKSNKEYAFINGINYADILSNTLAAKCAPISNKI